MANQIKALLVTLLLFGGVIWFVLGKPSFNLPQLSEIFERKESPSKKSTKSKPRNNSSSTRTGQVIDKYKGVDVFYNGSVGNVSGRNTTSDGYNLGLKYQCVEFAKRFYYEAYNHKMPDSYGHAKDFFDKSLADGAYNKARNMTQYRNGGPNKPRVDDLVVIGPTQFNSFGHLFVITKVNSREVSFVQQNPGQGNPSRATYKLVEFNGGWNIDATGVLGWLRI